MTRRYADGYTRVADRLGNPVQSSVQSRFARSIPRSNLDSTPVQFRLEGASIERGPGFARPKHRLGSRTRDPNRHRLSASDGRAPSPAPIDGPRGAPLSRTPLPIGPPRRDRRPPLPRPAPRTAPIARPTTTDGPPRTKKTPFANTYIDERLRALSRSFVADLRPLRLCQPVRPVPDGQGPTCTVIPLDRTIEFEFDRSRR